MFLFYIAVFRMGLEVIWKDCCTHGLNKPRKTQEHSHWVFGLIQEKLYEFHHLFRMYIKGKILNTLLSALRIFYSWCHQESNRGHKEFQSFALPTELWHHRFF